MMTSSSAVSPELADLPGWRLETLSFTECGEVSDCAADSIARVRILVLVTEEKLGQMWSACGEVGCRLEAEKKDDGSEVKKNKWLRNVRG